MIEQQYQHVLEYLYGLLPMYQRVGKKAFKKDLTNTRDLCWELGLPHWKFKSIHVAGTNGKGSVSSMLSSILIEAGYKTGLYTSPHLKSFQERIRINGQEISQQEVVEFVELYRHVIETIEPSFFELTVGMAFDHFAEQEVDIAVVEVGLGGRLDSTNIISPELSIITQIGLDHTDMLGDTLTEIAGEKAGIIKKFTPVVIGERHVETEAVFHEKAQLMEATLYFAEDMYRPSATEHSWQSQTFQSGPQDEDQIEQTFHLDLSGQYQRQNLATVLAAIDVLREDGWDIPEEAVMAGLQKVVPNSGLRGRMERLQEKPLVLADTAHNPSGVDAVLRQLDRIPHQELHIVWGMASDKNHDAILALLPKDANYYFVRPDVPRGLSSLTLQLKAEPHGLYGKIFDRVQDGMDAALAAAGPGDLVFVGGSTFVVAEVV